MSSLRSAKDDEKTNDKLAQFRGPGREIDKSAVPNQPVMIESAAATNASGVILKVSEATVITTRDDEHLKTPPEFNNKRQLGEKSIKRQVAPSRTKLLGGGGASVLSGLGTEEEVRAKINEVSLYGGAITAILPACWRDVSEVRQVPDHQEVWQDVSARAAPGEPPSMENLKIAASSNWLSSTDTGACIIFEILERQVEVSDDDAASFFFSDLAESNDAVEATTSWKAVFPTAEILPKHRKSSSGDTKVCAIKGRQKVRGSKGVDIQLVVVRLEAVQTDLVISYSIEREEEPPADAGEGVNEEAIDLPFDNVFKLVCESFKINDFALFV